MTLSRREFGQVVLAGAPLAAALAPFRLTAVGQIAFGVSTASFRDLPRVPGRDNVNDVIRALKAVGSTRVELSMANVEPAPPNTSPTRGGTPAYPQLIILTPDQIAAVRANYRVALRRWRAETDSSFFDQVRARLDAAGIGIYACGFAYDDASTDSELDATFRQAKALGARTVSSPMSLATAARLVPVAGRHGMRVAVRNDVDGNTAGAVGSKDLERVLALSPAFTLALDIGNLTASNADAAAALREYQARVSHVIVRDRLRNGGASQHFGEGDTPIAAVLNVLKSSAASIPAIVEYDYVGLHSSIEEVKAAVAYLTQAAG